METSLECIDLPYGPEGKQWQDTLSSLVSWKSTVEKKGLVSAPSSCDVISCEIVPEGITPALYQVPSTGLTTAQHDQAMKETLAVIEGPQGSLLGYACNRSFKVPSLFQCPFTEVMINNGGSPYSGIRSLSFRPKWMERNVLDYYASLWNAKWPYDQSDPLSCWGYILTMGSTEGNLHALWSARNYLSGNYLQPHTDPSKSDQPSTNPIQQPSIAPSMEPVVLYSCNTNGSLPRLCNMVNLPTFDVIGREKYPTENPLGGDWAAGVPCEGGDAGPGTIDISSLELLVDFFSSKGHPIVLVLNCGTTFKGSFDDVELAGSKMVEILKRSGMYERVKVDTESVSGRVIRKGFWVHIDGAFAAAYSPFLEMAYKNGLTDVQPPSPFDFRNDFVTSIVMSGHKFIGTPWPCGVYLVRHSEQIVTWGSTWNGSPDTTVGLSRNGHSSILLWSYISLNSYDSQVATVLECLHLVSYTLDQLRKLQSKLGTDLWITNYPPSLAILFRKPNSETVEKYTLFCPTVCIKSEIRHLSQIYIVPHVTSKLIDSLIEDLSKPDAFEF